MLLQTALLDSSSIYQILITAGVSTILAGTGLFFMQRHRKLIEQTRQGLESMSLEHKNSQSGLTERIDQVSFTLALLEASMKNEENSVRRGLSRSARSQAVQLLRAGMSPETTASSVGMPQKEVRLLMKVARLFSVS